MGVKVQVLKFSRHHVRHACCSSSLYELYRTCGGLLEEIPPAEFRAALEKNYFRARWRKIWQQTAAFFLKRVRRKSGVPSRAAKHRMALVFRWVSRPVVWRLGQRR